jgi:hypothetical protein
MNAGMQGLFAGCCLAMALLAGCSTGVRGRADTAGPPASADLSPAAMRGTPPKSRSPAVAAKDAKDKEKESDDASGDQAK